MPTITTIKNTLINNFLLIKFSNIIKIGALWLTDLLNLIYDKFDDFTRKADPKYQELFFVKAKRFENDLVQNFLLFNAVWNYYKPLDGSIDTGDQALHHGLATTYWAMKYGQTRDPVDLFQLNNSLVGLDSHQTIHGENKRRLIRGFRPMTASETAAGVAGTSWTNGAQMFFSPKGSSIVIEDSVSNDTASGHLAGIYFAWYYGDVDVKTKCATLIRGLADELMNNGNALINADGSQTQYGLLTAGVLADPLRISLCLAIYKVAYAITLDLKYANVYSEVQSLYNNLAQYAKVKLWWWENDEDAHRAALHLSILADLEKNGELLKDYQHGLHRTWYITRKTMNVWVNFLNARHNDFYLDTAKNDAYIQRSKDILSEFSFEDRQFNTQKINSGNTVFDEQNATILFQWGGNLRSSQPLPKWMIGAQDNFWQRNLNSVDNWQGNTSPSQQFNGLDYLLAYQLGVELGIFKNNE